MNDYNLSRWRGECASKTLTNSQQTCDVAGCSQARASHRLSHYCTAHWKNYSQWGHPLQLPLRSHLWMSYREAVLAVLKVNSDHPGTNRAATYVQRWMTETAQVAIDGSHKIAKGSKELLRLIRAGVTATEVIAEVVAVQAFLRDHPRAARNDKAFDAVISQAVFKLAPADRRPTSSGGSYPVKPTASAVAEVGEHLRIVLAPLTANFLASGVIELPSQAAARERQEAMVPLKPREAPIEALEEACAATA